MFFSLSRLSQYIFKFDIYSRFQSKVCLVSHCLVDSFKYVEARVPRIGYVLYCMYLYIRSSCYLCVKYIIPTGTVVLSIHHPPQLVTPVNDHAAVAAGHYGELLEDAPRLPVVFVAAVPPSSPALHHQRCFS